jgi:hypothetical protein
MKKFFTWLFWLVIAFVLGAISSWLVMRGLNLDDLEMSGAGALLGLIFGAVGTKLIPKSARGAEEETRAKIEKMEPADIVNGLKPAARAGIDAAKQAGADAARASLHGSRGDGGGPGGG